MSEGVEDILKIVFPHIVSDNESINEQANHYLSSLGGLNVDQISQEPERLKTRKTQLIEQTQELAFSNYKTFIETAECSRDVFQKFNFTEAKLDSLISELPGFNEKCQALSKTSSAVEQQKKSNSLVLSKSSQLLEILELPQLMENCIRNGNFEEALELATYVRRLGKNHGDIQILASIVQDFEASWLIMLEQLLVQLRTDLQLPKCLQVVGYLRRMEVFSEAELRLKFLQARDSWLTHLLANIPKDDGNQYLLKNIELSRIHLFNMVTQYRAIFSDEEPMLYSKRNVNVNETCIFYSWISDKISNFISTLDEQDQNKNLSSSIDSIMGQCMYFGLSFSRVGADFRALVAPKFIKIIEQNFETAIRKSNKKFESDMDKFVLKKESTLTKLKTQSDNKPEHPPMCLLEFYPLANYTNGLLAAFNDLRVCAPLAVADLVTNLIQESLKMCTKLILVFYKQEQQSFSHIEQENFTRFCGAFQILVNYLQKCIHLIFPVHVLASHLGILQHQLQKEGLTFLNESYILEGLTRLMPVEVLIPEGQEGERLGVIVQ